MRLLNYLAHSLPEAALWLHAPSGLARRQGPGPSGVCSTTTTVSLPADTTISTVTATYVKRQEPLACTTTFSVSLSTVTTIYSLTSTYSGSSSGNSSIASGTSLVSGSSSSSRPSSLTFTFTGSPSGPSSSPVRRFSFYPMLKTVLNGKCGGMMRLADRCIVAAQFGRLR